MTPCEAYIRRLESRHADVWIHVGGFDELLAFRFFFQIPLQLHFGIHALQLFEEQNGRSPEIR